VDKVDLDIIKLLQVPGVQRSQTSFILHTFKLSYAARPTRIEG